MALTEKGDISHVITVEECGLGWRALCPECLEPVDAATQAGLGEALREHLNREHVPNRRGDA